MTTKIGSQTQANSRPRNPADALANSTFSAGLQLLPDHLRADARSLYLLLRTIDDLVDDRRQDARERVIAIEHWAHSEEPISPEGHTLQTLAERYPISRQAVAEFCQGMLHDLDRETIETEADLDRYCHRVAGTVGILLAAILGAGSDEGLAMMATLGSAMQRTNILRDIDEDIEQGRIYIARTTINTHGFPHPGARELLLRDQIPRADALFDAGMGAIPMLRHGSEAMGLSVLLYREILRQIEREGFGRKPGRATVPHWRKRSIAETYSRKHIPIHVARTYAPTFSAIPRVRP